VTARSQPPVIPGLVYQEDLGTGGFADVYLYQSQAPKRLVAVKVLRTTDVKDRLVLRFTAEADVMAALEHPNIVRVYHAGITQDGRPFIEMAYYPYESLAEALRRGPFSVPDVLRIGVQLASAVETAHRAGLLHRDIKPANVLTDRYGQPALTDFGIASRLNEDNDEDAGLSVPWAPPEAMFSTAPVDPRSDVYSLAATLWHLLVGRAPFEVPGGDNRPVAMMVRTRDLPPPSTGRGDVPASLERLLASALSKDPRFRPSTAADFARALGSIEEELRLRPTPFIVERDPAVHAVTPPVAVIDDERTRRHTAPQVVPAQEQSAPPVLQPSERRALTPVEVAATVRRSGTPVLGAQGPAQATAAVGEEKKPDDESSRRRVVGPVVAVVIAVVVLAGGAGLLALHASGRPAESPSPSMSRSVGPVVGANLPPGPVTITCARSADQATVTCTWTYSNALTTDAYRVQLPGDRVEAKSTPEWSGPAPAGAPYCIRVKVVRQDGKFPAENWSEEGCA